MPLTREDNAGYLPAEGNSTGCWTFGLSAWRMLL